MRVLRIAVLALVAIVAGCVGTTGSGLVTFRFFASGPKDLDPSQPFQFDNGRGFHVLLTRATIHVGAAFLNRSIPIAGAQATSCILPGIYVGQVVPAHGSIGLDVDALSPTPQEFPALGSGTADAAVAGEVWLTGGDVNAAEDETVILDVAGTASREAETFRFEGRLTIGKNRLVASASSAEPGAHPICKQRIATPIPVDLTPREGGDLFLEIDPRGWFGNVDFSLLAPSASDPALFVFVDDEAGDAASRNLFLALHAFNGVYRFSWRDR